MNRFSSILLVSFVFILGFLLRGCAENEASNEQAASVVTIQDTTQNSVLLIAKDSLNDLNAQIELLKQKVGKQGKPSTIIVYKEVHDTTISTVNIPSLVEVEVHDTTYIDSLSIATRTLKFQNEFLFQRIVVGGSGAKIDSIAIFNTMKMAVSEIPISKYMSQKFVLFSPTNPYISNHSFTYSEVPRYTDLGISNLKKKEKRKGVLWGVLSTAAAATTYFILKNQ